MIFPQLAKIYKEEGEAGRKKFNQYCRIGAVPLAAIQGYAMLVLFQNQGVIGSVSPMIFISSIITITAGAIFLMWLGELISEKGIGNGVSLLIFAGIVADFPNSMRQLLVSWNSINKFLIFCLR
jgi:preprotein translocase subunit SecY